jgi:uncharacterized protein (TIGR02598 family)
MQAPRPRIAAARGFSLIEVTIAMAIAAVALVSLLGLIPQGMNTMREAGDEAIMARIHQQTLNEIQMADFDAIDTYHNIEFYYDGQGEELGDSRGTGGSGVKGSFEHIYTARVSIPAIPGAGAGGGGGGRMPQSVGGAAFNGFSFNGRETNNHIRPVVMEVAAVAGLGNQFDWSEQYQHLIRTYHTSVVKMSQSFGR